MALCCLSSLYPVNARDVPCGSAHQEYHSFLGVKDRVFLALMMRRALIFSLIFFVDPNMLLNKGCILLTFSSGCSGRNTKEDSLGLQSGLCPAQKWKVFLITHLSCYFVLEVASAIQPELPWCVGGQEWVTCLVSDFCSGSGRTIIPSSEGFQFALKWLSSS